MDSEARLIRLRRYSTCARCRRRMPTGWRAHYLPARREVRCLTCGPGPRHGESLEGRSRCRGCDRTFWLMEGAVTGPDDAAIQCAECAAIDAHHVLSPPGRGVELPHRGDRAARDERIRRSRRGAQREARFGRRLDAIASPDRVVLHDRRLPHRRANIDHIVVTPRCVWVIATQPHTGPARPRPQTTRLRRETPGLLVAGRDRQHLVEGVAQQAEAVRSVIAPLCEELDVPLLVRPALVLVDRGISWRKPHVDGVWIGAGRPLRRQLRSETPGPLPVDVVAKRLARELPAG